MNLVQFVELVRHGVSIEEIVARHSSLPNAEVVGVYMEQKVSLTSQLAFFDLEQVSPHLFITVDGQQYEAFFATYELADFIPDYAVALGTAATSLAIAEAILHYHEYDA